MEVLHSYEHEGLVLSVTEYDGPPSLVARQRPRTPAGARPPVPGAGVFVFDFVSAALRGDDVTVTAALHGRNIAYIYGEVLLKDPGGDRYYGPVVRQHVVAGRQRDIGGVISPEWPHDLDLQVTLHLSLNVLCDDRSAAFCFASPEGYDDPDRRLDGLYAPAGGTAPFRARFIIDRAGGVKRVIGYKSSTLRALPRPFRPRPGDRFTPFVEVLTPAVTNQAGGWSVARALTAPLTIGESGLTMVAKRPVRGAYLAGILVEDLDGGLTRQYARFAL